MGRTLRFPWFQVGTLSLLDPNSMSDCLVSLGSSGSWNDNPTKTRKKNSDQLTLVYLMYVRGWNTSQLYGDYEILARLYWLFVGYMGDENGWNTSQLYREARIPGSLFQWAPCHHYFFGWNPGTFWTKGVLRLVLVAGWKNPNRKKPVSGCKKTPVGIKLEDKESH